MDIVTASFDHAGLDYLPVASRTPTPAQLRPAATDPAHLRHVAWEIGERRPADRWAPREGHVGLAMVHPTRGFVFWRVKPDWVEQVARARGGAFDGSRLVARLYDVSYVHFTGLNAHRIQDHDLPGLSGQFFFDLAAPGSWQIAEVGFLLRNGEFVPAARSVVVPFAPDAPSRRGGHEALLTYRPGHVEHVGNVWDQENILRERRKPRLRQPLRLLALSFSSRAGGQAGAMADFTTELAAGWQARGCEAHVMVPASDALAEPRQIDGVHYHPLPGVEGDGPLEAARRFGRAAAARLKQLPAFDLIHQHEWMTALGPWSGPTVLSLGSIEATRRNGHGTTPISAAIEAAERQAARAAGCVLTPPWLRERAVGELGLEAGRTHAFAMEGRVPNEWEAPLDFGHVKMRFGLGPLDRVLIFIGPLEHATGVDLLLEALPVALGRHGNVRLAVVGDGPMRGWLERRAHEVGVGWAVRFLGDMGGSGLHELLRSSEALVLPSRHRIAMDDAVVDLARKAGRAVVTTHGGPAYLVRHEEDGLVTYDNPGSMVWAMDRALSDADHTRRMGEKGRRQEGGAVRWSDVAGHYLEGCVAWFPELTEARL